MKMIAFFWRKHALTPVEFREYYEKKHVPLALKLFPFFMDYRRNYIRHDAIHARQLDEPAAVLDFDVITEITFACQADYDRMVSQMTDPAVRKQVVEDEKRFMDRRRTVVHLVHEERTIYASN